MEIKANEITIVNANFNLENVKLAIQALEGNMNKNLFTIANLLNRVQSTELYKGAGFKNIAEWSEKELGYKKVFTYGLVKVAARFLNGQSVSPFKQEDEKDYTVSQLIELTTLEDVEIRGLINEGELSPYMSTKEIRQLVKDTKSIETKMEEVVEEGTPNDENKDNSNNTTDKEKLKNVDDREVKTAADKKKLVLKDLTTLNTGLENLLKMMSSSKATKEEKVKFKEYHEKVANLLAGIIDEI